LKIARNLKDWWKERDDVKNLWQLQDCRDLRAATLRSAGDSLGFARAFCLTRALNIIQTPSAFPIAFFQKS